MFFTVYMGFGLLDGVFRCVGGCWEFFSQGLWAVFGDKYLFLGFLGVLEVFVGC